MALATIVSILVFRGRGEQPFLAISTFAGRGGKPQGEAFASGVLAKDIIRIYGRVCISNRWFALPIAFFIKNRISLEFDFSGGQIENIARKFTINKILYGESEDNINTLVDLCSSEH